jgi:hypothetical protein
LASEFALVSVAIHAFRNAPSLALPARGRESEGF